MDADQPNATEALDHIENEIREIDQMIYSWSSGRTLRFDPAHVKPAKDSTPAPVIASKPTRYSIGRIFFWFNLIAFSLPIGIMAFQSLAKALSPKIESFILTLALMILAGGNLVLAAFESSRIKTPPGEKRTKVRSNRNQTSLRSSA